MWDTRGQPMHCPTTVLPPKARCAGGPILSAERGPKLQGHLCQDESIKKNLMIDKFKNFYQSVLKL
jgi:hypothetical protein